MFVVQAVPVAKSKKIYVVTAYIGKSENKKGTFQSIDAKSPNETSKNVTENAPKETIQTTDASPSVTSKTETAEVSVDNVSQKHTTVKVETYTSENGYTVTPNVEYDSIEVTFNEKTSETVRNALKDNKFRWNNKKKLWYGKTSQETIVNALDKAYKAERAETEQAPKGKAKPAKADIENMDIADVMNLFYDGSVINMDAFNSASNEEIAEILKPDEDGEYSNDGISWAYETDKFTKQDAAFISSTVADIAIRGYKGYNQNKDGEYVIDKGNKIFFVKVDYNNPQITRFAVLNDTNETDMLFAKEMLRNADGLTKFKVAKRAIQILRGESYITDYSNAGYREVGRKVGRGEGRGLPSYLREDEKGRLSYRFDDDLEQDSARYETISNTELLEMASEQIVKVNLTDAQMNALGIFNANVRIARIV